MLPPTTVLKDQTLRRIGREAFLQCSSPEVIPPALLLQKSLSEQLHARSDNLESHLSKLSGGVAEGLCHCRRCQRH